MASGGDRRPNRALSADPNGREGARRGQAAIVVDAESFAMSMVGHEELQRMARRYLELSMREMILLREANARLEEQVAALRRQVAELVRQREEDSAAPEKESQRP